MSAYLRYEFHRVAASRSLRLVIALALGVSLAMTIVVALSAESYMELGRREYWVLIATQGGTFSWSPYFAYLLALYGVLVWADDVRDESAYVAYLTFGSRREFASVRSAGLTLVSVLVSVSSFAVAIGTTVIFFDTPSADGLFAVLAVKLLWTVICGVALAHVGAALCVVFRSARIALCILLLVPWMVEPILVQLVELVPALHRFGPASSYLPFRAIAATLGRRQIEGGLDHGAAALAPRSAAVFAVIVGLVAVALVQWRYCKQDGATDG